MSVTRGAFTIIEDNDPTGYKSKSGLAAKAECNIIPDDLPKRSPDLNVLDYCLWHEVNKRMRAQERKFSKSKTETQTAFKERLRKTAMSLPTSLVTRAVGSMRRRCHAVKQMKGGLFTE